jgi:hypothetical protein
MDNTNPDAAAITRNQGDFIFKRCINRKFTVGNVWFNR